MLTDTDMLVTVVSVQNIDVVTWKVFIIIIIVIVMD